MGRLGSTEDVPPPPPFCHPAVISAQSLWASFGDFLVKITLRTLGAQACHPSHNGYSRGRVLIGEGLKGLFSGVLVLTGGTQASRHFLEMLVLRHAPSSFPKPSRRLGCALRVLNSVLQPAKCS